MKHLVSIKLKQQDVDLIGYQSAELEDSITIDRPVQVKLDTNQGFFAVDWLYLADKKTVSLNKADIFYYTEPSERAHTIYDEFWHNISNDDFNNDDEDLLAIFESKLAIKH